MKTALRICILTLALGFAIPASAAAKLKALVLELPDDREGAAKLIWNEIDKAQKAGEFAAFEFLQQPGIIYFLTSEVGRKYARAKLRETGADALVWGKVDGNITIVGISWRGKRASGHQAFVNAPISQLLFFFKDHSLDKRKDVLVLALKALDRYVAQDYEQARSLFEKLFESAGSDFELDGLSLFRGWCWIFKYKESLDPSAFDKARHALLTPFKKLKERTYPELAGSLKSSLAYLYLLKAQCEPEGAEELKSSAETLIDRAEKLFEISDFPELAQEAAKLTQETFDCPSPPSRLPTDQPAD